MLFTKYIECKSKSRSMSEYRTKSSSWSNSWARSEYLSISRSRSESWSTSRSRSGIISYSKSTVRSWDGPKYASECQGFRKLAYLNSFVQIKEIENNQNCSEVGSLIKLPRTIGIPWGSFCLEKTLRSVKIHEKEVSCLVLGNLRVKLGNEKKVNLTKVLIRDKIWAVWR